MRGSLNSRQLLNMELWFLTDYNCPVVLTGQDMLFCQLVSIVAVIIMCKQVKCFKSAPRLMKVPIQAPNLTAVLFARLVSQLTAASLRRDSISRL